MRVELVRRVVGRRRGNDSYPAVVVGDTNDLRLACLSQLEDIVCSRHFNNKKVALSFTLALLLVRWLFSY